MYGYLDDSMISRETEKAYEFQILIETYSGKLVPWTVWLPKKVYSLMSKMECEGGTIAHEVNSFVLKLWEGKLPTGAKEIR